MPIKVDILPDGEFEIEWDGDDPTESQLNDWSEQDFVDAISEACRCIMSGVTSTDQDYDDTNQSNC